MSSYTDKEKKEEKDNIRENYQKFLDINFQPPVYESVQYDEDFVKENPVKNKHKENQKMKIKLS